MYQLLKRLNVMSLRIRQLGLFSSALSIMLSLALTGWSAANAQTATPGASGAVTVQKAGESRNKTNQTGKAAGTAKNDTYASVEQATIEGKSLSGKAFTLASLKGKVVLMVYWTTDCNVCLDIIPELRNNSKGWAKEPFHVLLLSNDSSLEQLMLYENVLKLTLPAHLQLTQLWTKAPDYQDNLTGLKNLNKHELPVSALIDKQGKVVKWFKGRIPADAWNDIADLL
jgi:peroxiredoxin